MTIKVLCKKILNRIVNIWDHQIVPKNLGYFSPRETVGKAQKKGLSLCEYLEENNLGGVGKRRDLIITTLRQHLPSKLSRVLEIGAGTGMFLEKIAENHSPDSYEVYETLRPWVKYLDQTYSGKTGLKCYEADGVSLKQTPSESVDAAFSHGVFVYLPLLTTFGYLEEMARVVKPGGWIIFDCFPTKGFTIGIVKQWQNNPQHGSWPVTISDELIEEYIDKYGLIHVDRFNAPYHASFSTYFILRKKSHS